MKRHQELERDMPNFGPPELIIILFIALLLFGVGRLGRLGGELGRGIREFRQGLKDEEPNQTGPDDQDAT